MSEKKNPQPERINIDQVISKERANFISHEAQNYDVIISPFLKIINKLVNELNYERSLNQSKKTGKTH